MRSYDGIAGLPGEHPDQPAIHGQRVRRTGLDDQVGEPAPLIVAGNALRRLPGRVDVAVGDQDVDQHQASRAQLAARSPRGLAASSRSRPSAHCLIGVHSPASSATSRSSS